MATILTVEDSATQAEMLRRSLAGQGHVVTVAKDGAEGLAMAYKKRPDLIISDISMPVMNGYEMCQAIKQDSVLMRTPVLLLTSLSEVTDVIHGLAAGADAYITKPYDEKHLLARVNDLLTMPAPLKVTMAKEEPLTVRLAGEHYTVTAGRQQILNLLISTYENAVAQNRELLKVREDLLSLNEGLEKKMQERAGSASPN